MGTISVFTTFPCESPKTHTTIPDKELNPRLNVSTRVKHFYIVRHVNIRKRDTHNMKLFFQKNFFFSVAIRIFLEPCHGSCKSHFHKKRHRHRQRMGGEDRWRKNATSVTRPLVQNISSTEAGVLTFSPSRFVYKPLIVLEDRPPCLVLHCKRYGGRSWLVLYLSNHIIDPCND